MGRLTKIEAKPEQSKHLETATARVCNLSVDWVQQRGQEVYTVGSRIPTVVSFLLSRWRSLHSVD
jgi:tRNA nucleotidyltransferase (CCA-adding enzyme)